MRQRLVALVESRSEAQVILISAPAGYGKSVLLQHLAHARIAAGDMVVWCSLDELDDDPARFAQLLASACREAGLFSDEFFREGQPVDLLSTTSGIVNGVTQRAHPLWLFVDDYHLITSLQIHHAMNRLGAFMPPGMRLAIASRADPPLPLARLKTSHLLLEVRMGDLRFLPEEGAQFVQKETGALLNAHTMERLEFATEGWAAALALFCMQVGPTTFAHDEQRFEEQLSAFTHVQGDLFDYFALEVLDRLPPEERDFLLDTSILERLSPGLCAAVTNRADAGSMLHTLAKSNLFISTNGQAGSDWRYHHLFRDFLRNSLLMHDPGRLAERHRRAAVWHSEHGQCVEAVFHALDAGELTWAAALIEEVAWPELTARGEIVTFLRWLPHFTEQVLRTFPRLCLYFSRALYLTGDLASSGAFVQSVLTALKTNDQESDSTGLQAIACNYQATLYGYRGEIEKGLTLNARARLLQAEASPLDRVRIANTEGYLHFLSGNVVAARQAYEEAYADAREQGHHYLELDALGYLICLDTMEGRLHDARQRAEETLARYASPITPLSAIMVPLALVYHEQGESARAETLLRDAIDLARGGLALDILWAAHLALAQVLGADGRHPEALAEADQARLIASRLNSPYALDQIRAVRVRLLLVAGSIERAGESTYQAGMPGQAEYCRDPALLAQAYLLAQTGHPQESTVILRQLEIAASDARRYGVLVEARVLLTQCYRALGNHRRAEETLIQAMKQAAPERHIRPFLDDGKTLRPLLNRIASQGIETEFTALLLARLESSAQGSPSALLLTPRELEILALIAAGKSNQEIAVALVISLGTVKSHINHMMTKLDARNRTEAVARARLMKLL